MTDEEMAEEYADNETNCYVTLITRKEWDRLHRAYKYGFLTGLRIGWPQWHDLRKDENDLPKDDRYVLIATQKRVYLGFYDCCWFSHETDDIGKVLAWCEIPTFDKE